MCKIGVNTAVIYIELHEEQRDLSVIGVVFRILKRKRKKTPEGLLAWQVERLILVREGIPHQLEADIAVRVRADDATIPADNRINAAERSGHFGN